MQGNDKESFDLDSLPHNLVVQCLCALWMSLELILYNIVCLLYIRFIFFYYYLIVEKD